MSSSLNKALIDTGYCIEAYAKTDLTKLPAKDMRHIASNLHKANASLLAAISDIMPAELDPAVVQKLMSIANKLSNKAKNSLEARKTGVASKQKFNKELLELKKTLAFLKQQNLAVPLTDTKIKGIGKSEMNDLNHLLYSADRGLLQLKKFVKSNQEVPQVYYRSLTAILKKTIAVCDISPAEEPILDTGVEEGIITKILKDIPYIQYRIGAQVRAGTFRAKNNVFRNTLKKFETLLLVLKKLKKSRGGQTASVDLSKF